MRGNSRTNDALLANSRTGVSPPFNDGLEVDSPSQKNQPLSADATKEGMDSVLVGIPAYNEEVAIGSVTLVAKQISNEVVIVDDGSDDQTASIASLAGATVIEHQSNRGKGHAIKTILKYSRYVDFDALVLIDGDGQHRPSEIPRLVSPIFSDDADVVIGTRYYDPSNNDETPLYRRFGQFLLDTATNWVSGIDLTDTQSGFRALSPEAVAELSFETDGIGVESEMIVEAAKTGLSIEEVPISVRYEGIDGQSHQSVRHGVAVLVNVLRQYLK